MPAGTNQNSTTTAELFLRRRESVPPTTQHLPGRYQFLHDPGSWEIQKPASVYKCFVFFSHQAVLSNNGLRRSSVPSAPMPLGATRQKQASEGEEEAVLESWGCHSMCYNNCYSSSHRIYSAEMSDLATIRRRLGLSQEQMARVLGVSFASVNRWEGGHSSPAGPIRDLYQAIDAAMRCGHTPESIRKAADNERGVFLHALFHMAYANTGRSR